MFIPHGLFFSIFNNSIMFMKGLRFALLSLNKDTCYRWAFILQCAV